MRLATRRGLGGLAASLLAAPSLHAQPGPRIFALLVGINDYLHARKLQGCVNDAQLIAEALSPITDARDVTKLLDADATRSAFLRAWDARTSAARPGDTIILTFAGHGGQQTQARPGNETDFLDETLIFHAYAPQPRQNRAELIIDDELGNRLAASGAKGIRTIFLSDSCHAGTLTRGIDFRAEAFGSRTIGDQEVDAATLASFDVPSQEIGGHPNLLFIAGCGENQLVHEYRIGQRIHGAASVAFARAITRSIAAGEFPGPEAFAHAVMADARQVVQGQQHPVAENTLPVNQPLIPLRGSAPAPAPAPAPPPAPNLLRLHVMPGGGPLAEAARGLVGVQLIPTREGADAVLDPGRGELISGQGDVVAAELNPGSLAGAMEKLAALRLMLGRNLPPMDIGLVPEGAALAPGGGNARDERHRPGVRFDLVIRPPAPAAILAVSVGPGGTVRVLSTTASAGGPIREYRQLVEVRRERGAGHVFAVALTGSVAEAQAALAPLDRERVPMAAVRALLAVPGARAAGVFGFFIE